MRAALLLHGRPRHLLPLQCPNVAGGISRSPAPSHVSMNSCTPTRTFAVAYAYTNSNLKQNLDLLQYIYILFAGVLVVRCAAQ